MEVRNPQDEKLGSIEDVVMDIQSGRISYMVLSVGGFLGIGEKLIAVPPSAFNASTSEDHLVVNVDRSRIEQAPGLTRGNWPSSANVSWGSSSASWRSSPSTPGQWSDTPSSTRTPQSQYSPEGDPDRFSATDSSSADRTRTGSYQTQRDQARTDRSSSSLYGQSQADPQDDATRSNQQFQDRSSSRSYGQDRSSRQPQSSYGQDPSGTQSRPYESRSPSSYGQSQNRYSGQDPWSSQPSTRSGQSSQSYSAYDQDRSDTWSDPSQSTMSRDRSTSSTYGQSPYGTTPDRWQYGTRSTDRSRYTLSPGSTEDDPTDSSRSVGSQYGSQSDTRWDSSRDRTPDPDPSMNRSRIDSRPDSDRFEARGRFDTDSTSRDRFDSSTYDMDRTDTDASRRGSRYDYDSDRFSSRYDSSGAGPMDATRSESSSRYDSRFGAGSGRTTGARDDTDSRYGTGTRFDTDARYQSSDIETRYDTTTRPRYDRDNASARGRFDADTEDRDSTQFDTGSNLRYDSDRNRYRVSSDTGRDRSLIPVEGEIVAIDAKQRTVTIRTASGGTRTFNVTERPTLNTRSSRNPSLIDFKPGHHIRAGLRDDGRTIHTLIRTDESEVK